MATKLKLYRAACRALKQTPIVALTDDVFIRYELDDVFDECAAWSLSEGYWNFAMRTVSIDHSTDIEPSFGYSNAFEKPDDWVRTAAISDTPLLWPELGPNAYIDETTNWGADCDPLYVSYVSNDVEFGMNLANWSPTFTRAVSLELAWRIAPTTIGIDQSAKDSLEKDKIKAMRDARSKDAQNGASKRPPPGRLTSSRAGRFVRGWSGTLR